MREFDLAIDYRATSRETILLGEGWGMRDVRGSYVMKSRASLIIPAALLVGRVPSSVELTFGLSSRFEGGTLGVQAFGLFGIKSCLVPRNGNNCLQIDDLRPDPDGVPSIIGIEVDRHTYFPEPVLSLDKLHMWRIRPPF